MTGRAADRHASIGGGTGPGGLCQSCLCPELCDPGRVHVALGFRRLISEGAGFLVLGTQHEKSGAMRSLVDGGGLLGSGTWRV